VLSRKNTAGDDTDELEIAEVKATNDE